MRWLVSVIYDEILKGVENEDSIDERSLNTFRLHFDWAQWPRSMTEFRMTLRYFGSAQDRLSSVWQWFLQLYWWNNMEGVTNTLLPARMFLICRRYHCENGKESPIVEDLVTRHRRAPVGL